MEEGEKGVVCERQGERKKEDGRRDGHARACEWDDLHVAVGVMGGREGGASARRTI